jgi:hypothetical protein
MFLRIYVAALSLVVVVLATAAFRQAGKPQNLGEITVERINVVDANGTLRLVIANKDRMHPGVMDGITIDRPRPEAGLLFFNDEGDEIGGLTYQARLVNGQQIASTALNFDQFKQDQTIGISYGESQGVRSAALRVWDRPDVHLTELIKRSNEIKKLPEAEREAAMRDARASLPGGHERVFVGKDTARASHVTLSDANGKPRLKLTVEADGGARIEFLDENGRVTNRLPQVQ